MIDFNIDNYLRISWQDVLLVCISTFIIVVVCKHFFWNKLLDFIKARQDMIQENIENSEKIKEQATQLKNHYDEKMRDAGKEANEIISNAKLQADLEKNQIIDCAKKQAANIERAAQEEIARDRLRAEQEMKTAITDVAFAAASSILADEINEEKQKKLVDQFIDEAGKNL